ncbi:3-methyladenine DNA glycosylase [Pseudoroseomonas rhizosphaerae]|uniref:Putative 3-methyladenine DNA glycosylase n=1 Tax=Teichococcus rhizosphaerae TaxID=1335062 RepID=A0A2C7AG52_9PROT|nr:DNA-3-methyladenine glycosylase [Pseudoroseomonas rhizosphaerae]PHK96074.1 3-methyladenine DNA glycosylase [Pseudoroseomonas rhizosphaerae]
MPMTIQETDPPVPPDARLPEAFYRQPPPRLARALIGCRLFVDGAGGRIVETEAYDADDPASHSFGGRTLRNASMFGPPGHAYVYRSYGLHWCLNVVCGTVPGGAVLIRALEPERGLDRMQARRGGLAPRDLCRGPGRLCQALAVTGALDGCSMSAPPFILAAPVEGVAAIAGRRIGITRGAETPWRFGLAGSRFLSRPLRD